MLDKDTNGTIYFMYRTSPNWIRPDAIKSELLLIKRRKVNGAELSKPKYAIVYREKYASEGFNDFYKYRKNLKKIEKGISKEQFVSFLNIIEQNSELITVNRYLHTNTCDGTYQELLLKCKKFERKIEGTHIIQEEILENVCLEKLYESGLDKNSVDICVVSKVSQQIFKRVKLLGFKIDY